MKLTGIAAGTAAIVIAAASAYAQPAPQAQGPAQSSSQGQAPMGPPGGMMGRGPGAGMMGRGAGGGMGMRWGAQNTYGWSMMTPAERQEHMARMRSFTNRKDCQAYVAEHHRLMVERARQHGMTMPAEPRRDPCAGLK